MFSWIKNRKPLDATPSLRGLKVIEGEGDEGAAVSTVYPWDRVGGFERFWNVYDTSGELLCEDGRPVRLWLEKAAAVSVAKRAQCRYYKRALNQNSLQLREIYNTSGDHRWPLAIAIVSLLLTLFVLLPWVLQFWTLTFEIPLPAESMPLARFVLVLMLVGCSLWICFWAIAGLAMARQNIAGKAVFDSDGVSATLKDGQHVSRRWADLEAVYAASRFSELSFCDGMRITLRGRRSRTRALVAAAGDRHAPERAERARRKNMRQGILLLMRWTIAAAVVYVAGTFGRRAGWIPEPVHIVLPIAVLLAGTYSFVALHAPDLEKMLSRFLKRRRSK